MSGLPADATMEDMIATLMDIIQESGSTTCMDCTTTNPRWAVVNWGIFVCIRCSGIHRQLGTHVSKVKSVNLDKWTVDEVRWMETMGNRRAAKALEANVGKGWRKLDEHATASEVTNHLKSKYERLEFAKEGKKPPTLKAWLKREAKKAAEGGSRKEKKEKKDKKEKKEKKKKRESWSDSEGDEESSEAETATATGSPSPLVSPVAVVVKEKDKKEKKEKKEKREASPTLSRGAYGEVTGDPSTAAERQSQLLSLFGA